MTGRGRRVVRSAWTLAAGASPATSAGMALLVLGTAFLAMAIPRATLGARTQALRYYLAHAPATNKDIVATIDYPSLDGTGYGGKPITASQFPKTRHTLAANLGTHHLLLAPGRSWSGLTSPYTTVKAGASAPAFYGGGIRKGNPPEIEILYRDKLGQLGRLVAGKMPGAGRNGSCPASLQVAVTRATAARLGVAPGSCLTVAPGVKLLVTGILVPVMPGSTFWTLDPVAAAPALIPKTPLAPAHWAVAAFVGPTGLRAMQTALVTDQMEVTWAFPVSTADLTADQASAFLARLAAAVTAGGTITNLPGFEFQGVTSGSGMSVMLSSGLIQTLSGFTAQDQAISSVLSLLFASVIAIGMVAVLLAGALVAERRAGEFALHRARGAGLRQVALRTLGSSAILTLPAAAAGIAVAVVVTPADGGSTAWWLAGLVVVTALAGLPAFAVVGQRRAARVHVRPGGAPVTSRRLALRRLIAEVALVAAAVGGIVVLRSQGLTVGGFDAYVGLAPVLVALPAAIVVARAYPIVVRMFLRLARGRGVSAFVGLARARIASVSAIVPMFALVLALGLVAFGTMISDAVHRSEVAASWQQVGADAIIYASQSSRPVTPTLSREISGIPGAVHTASVVVTTASLPGRSGVVTIAAVDPARYAALVATSPAAPFPASSLARRVGTAGVPALANSAAARLTGSSHALKLTFDDGRTVAARVVGHSPGIQGVGPGPLIVLPTWALPGRLRVPSVVLVAGPQLDTAKLATVVHRGLPGAHVGFRARALAALDNAPLAHGADVAIAETSAAAAGLSGLIMLMSLLLTARSRELTLARLSTMGLGRGQARRLALLEMLPRVLAATAGGVACALALAPLLKPAISLSAFTPFAVGTQIRTEPVPMLAVAAGLVLLAVLALGVQLTVTRRRGVAGALRVD